MSTVKEGYVLKEVRRIFGFICEPTMDPCPRDRLKELWEGREGFLSQDKLGMMEMQHRADVHRRQLEEAQLTASDAEDRDRLWLAAQYLQGVEVSIKVLRS